MFKASDIIVFYTRFAGTNMDHYRFECAARWRAQAFELQKNWHYIAFYETEGAKYNRPTYRCTVSNTIYTFNTLLSKNVRAARSVPIRV